MSPKTKISVARLFSPELKHCRLFLDHWFAICKVIFARQGGLVNGRGYEREEKHRKERLVGIYACHNKSESFANKRELK
jgi:hypothetical protein